MDNHDDSENNAKVSDSAYSNSCSNSQSRRSRSSKSTHSGSNSSGSSGYGGKPTTSTSSNNLSPQQKKEKDVKKQSQLETTVADTQAKTEMGAQDPVINEIPYEETHDVNQTTAPVVSFKKDQEHMDTSDVDKIIVEEEMTVCNIPTLNTSIDHNLNHPNSTCCSEGFSCVISMHDGIVMYTTTSLTTILAYPKEMWIGRSFIDFVHPRDRSTFASQITNGLATPKVVNGTQEKAQSPENPKSTMVCRIRRYRGLTTGFAIKENNVNFMAFLLKLTFKNISDEDNKVMYLIIHATPFYSAFNSPREMVKKPIPFVVRHAANGNLEYIDHESVPYLGYMPQDIYNKDALLLYHPDDLGYLRHVYETIVKEGTLTRSKCYRMMAQNGDYLRLETEWSSFINPWSKKLEFIIGKHYVLEGPVNPDVFQEPDTWTLKLINIDKNRTQLLRESIIRIMNEVLTKPAEVAKQQMSIRCQDLASFMESLMEEQPKTEDDLRLEVQDADNSYYERDSVMLGGISPHHEYNDSKSSTETPLSYNQLNYKETLQRYFDSNEPDCYEDYNTEIDEKIPATKRQAILSRQCCDSPTAHNSRDSGDCTSSGESTSLAVGWTSPTAQVGDYNPVRLTEILLDKHNAEMVKELVKMRRESKSSNKSERENANEKRQKKIEHLARCNASFQPTMASAPVEIKSQGVKRCSKPIESEACPHKYHCSSVRQSRRKPTTSAAPVKPSTVTTATRGNHWPTYPARNFNTFLLGIPQQMSIVSPVPVQPAVQGMFPLYYAPQQTATAPTSSRSAEDNNNPARFQTPPAMQYMMYGQAVYGSPFLYSPFSPQLAYPTHDTTIRQPIPPNTTNSLCLSNSNFEQACKPGESLKPSKPCCNTWRGKKHTDMQDTATKNERRSAECHFSNNALYRNTKYVTEQTNHPMNNKLRGFRLGNHDEIFERTDDESSYSSLYSSFFKTDSGSAEESSDAKNRCTKDNKTQQVRNVAKRKMNPPWMEQVCVTSELVYKYQVFTKSMEEVLIADQRKMSSLEQPTLVNEQLGQLYLDLQLEGVAARLTLEEGITSSSSSGDEKSTSKKKKEYRKKRGYSKLVMIHEEDAPFPSSSENEETANTATS